MFITALNDELAGAIRDIVTDKGIDFKNVQTKEDALFSKDADAEQSRTVYLVNVDFARGYDLKLTKDALVLIMDNDESLVMTTAE